MLYGENVVCVYRDADLDSFVGAWAVWKRFPNASFYTRVETLLPSQVEGRDLYVIGSFTTLGNLIALSYHCKSLTLIAYESSFAQEVQSITHPLPGNLRIVFDEQRSLAGLCWDHFSLGDYRAPVVNYIEDKVLWRYQYPETRPVTAALVGYPLSFERWDNLILDTDVQELCHEGDILLRRLARDIETAIRYSRRRVNIGGYDVPIANVTPTLASEACIQLAKGEPFAACYWDTPEGRVFDLVSTGDGIDVSELVRAFGGHGNRYEAKFQVPRTHPLAAV